MTIKFSDFSVFFYCTTSSIALKYNYRMLYNQTNFFCVLKPGRVSYCNQFIFKKVYMNPPFPTPARENIHVSFVLNNQYNILCKTLTIVTLSYFFSLVYQKLTYESMHR